MTFATSFDGASIYFETHGKGVPIVLSAGMGGGGGFWAPQIEQLAKRHQVIVYDHVGTARSRDDKPIDRTIAGMAGDIASVLDHLGLDSAHVVGHAIGGIVGLELAMTQPRRLRSVTVVNGWGRADAFLRRCFEVRREILRVSGPKAYVRAQPLFLFPPQWIAENEARLDADEPHIISHFPPAETMNARIEMFLAFDPGERLQTIKTPVLVTTAADDALVPAYLTRELAAAIPGATLKEVSYGAHAFTAVTPEVFNTMLLEFLAGVDGAS
ncbi:pyrimidine utilization protein D [Tardiphaga sp.]|jgi:aminoacrylate hydrolase|uniref:pyrimidine utilization protein D n=1 Tax=Tardiphaga sp. TaxID=1926292 RepID=UPI0037DA45D3